MSPSRRRCVDDRPPLGGVGRLAGARDADRDAEPARGEPDAPLGQLDPFAGADVGPADVAAADLDPMPGEVVAERLGRRVVGLLGDHGRFGDHQPAEVVAPQRQLEVVDPGVADPLDGRPDARGPVAIGEATDDPIHRSWCDVFGRLHRRASHRRRRSYRLEGDGKLAPRVDDAEGEPALEDVEQDAAAELRCASLAGGQGGRDSARPSRCQRIRCLRSATLADERAGDLVLRAALGQGRGEQVGDGREAGRLLVPGGELGKLRPRGPARASVEDRAGSRRSGSGGPAG